MAETMWNQDVNFDSVAEKYFLETFGPDGKIAEDYLSSLSELFDHKYFRNMSPIFDEEIAKKFDIGVKTIEEFRAVIQEQLKCAKVKGLLPAQMKSWEYLIPHGELYTLIGKSFSLMARGEIQQAEAMRDSALAYAREIEEEMQYLFDTFEFCFTYRDMSFAIHLRRAKEQEGKE